MIIINLMGGMGNQMFQYAFGKNLSMMTGKKLYIDLYTLEYGQFGSDDVRNQYKNNPENFAGLGKGMRYRNYDLNLFNIEESFIDKKDIKNVVKITEFGNYDDNVFNKVRSYNTNIYLSGFWQNINYFRNIENIIKKEFTLKNEISERTKILKDEILSRNSVLINIRRDDYLNTSHHGVMGVDYVNKAKNIIESKVNDPYYYIFSDDIKWCEENLKFDNSMIVDHSYKGDRFGEYLELMKNCKHFIIPNSSFAWWAAWLSESENKIIIHPNKWLSYGSHQITSGLGWIGID